MTTINKPILYRHSEANPFEPPINPNNPEKSKIFQNSKEWAKETSRNANSSIYAYLAELPLKIISYFVLHSDFEANIWTKIFSAAEDLSGFIGDRSRNEIYSHKNEKGEYDDIIGEQEYTANKESTFSLAKINNFIQTKAQALLVPLSLVNPELANDLQWSVVKNVDGCWWRNMSIERAFGAGFWKKLFASEEGSPGGFAYFKQKFSENFSNLRKVYSEYSNNQDKDKKKDLSIKLYNNVDKAISSFFPIVQVLNTFGDIARPIARRLEIEGFTRNTIRFLSMVDRPFTWFTNIFRFYLPEKVLKKDLNPDTKILPDELPNEPGDKSDLLLLSTIGDIFDFGTVLFEDSIKESSGMMDHLVQIFRNLSSSAQDIYFSSRRKNPRIEVEATTS